jgi:hypothetical protein
VRSFLVRLVQMILDIVAALLGFYYSQKYAAIVKWLGLRRIAAPERKGFIVIQVDGLAHQHLTSAIDLGYVPTLERLLRRGDLVLRRWHSGLPCTTPAAQAGIMFGNNDDIPAFRWYDKTRNEAIVCKPPSTIRAIQERISAGRVGILTEGSSFMNMFDGDASLSMFTLGAMHRKRFFESVRGLGFFVLFILNPFRSLMTLVFTIWEYLTEVVQHVRALFGERAPRPLDPGFCFSRVMASVVFRDVQTFALLVDIYRGVPALYTTYYGYDHLAHHYGPLSKPALRALRAIDARVRRIDKLRRLGLSRDYDLYVLSDHGMTQAVPFRQTYGQTLGEAISEVIGDQRMRISEAFAPERQEMLEINYLLDELAALEANVRPPLSYVPRKIRSLVRRRITLDEEILTDWDPERRLDLVVRNSGSLSHVYLNVVSRQMNLSEIGALYPSLIGDLAAHPGIWLVIAREDDQVVVFSREGVLTLGQGQYSGHDYRVEGRDPLACFATPQLQAAQIRRLASFAHAGDLILMGHYDAATETVTCFEDQWACHGALGGPQEVAFLAMDRSIRWNSDSVTWATQLYPLFAERYLSFTPDAPLKDTVAECARL